MNAGTTMRMYGIIKMASEKADWGFVSNVMHVDGDTFLHCSDFGTQADMVPGAGTWVEYDFDIGPKGPRATKACACELTQEELMDRLLDQYGEAMKNNVMSLRLDGLTMQEAKDMLLYGRIGRQEYYARMSENGLKEVARHHQVPYVPGRQMDVAAAIVASIEARESGGGQ